MDDRIQKLAEELAQVRPPGGEYKEPEVNHREDAPRAGQLAALAVAKMNEATAQDLERAAQSLVDKSLAIQAEVTEFAKIIRDHGSDLFARIEDYSARADKAANTFRETKEDILRETSGG